MKSIQNVTILTLLAAAFTAGNYNYLYKFCFHIKKYYLPIVLEEFYELPK